MKLKKGDVVQGMVVGEDHPTPVRLELAAGNVYIDCGDGRKICLNKMDQYIVLDTVSINAIKTAMEHCYRMGYGEGWNTAIKK